MKKLVFLFFVLIFNLLFAQEDEKILTMSLEDLMKVPVVSASKKAESSFDAPLSSSVITREELLRAGVTTISEAFKLVPGLIVREQTNGVFDVHLRGLGYLPYSTLTYSQNQITLVMVDNRIIYRDFQGGTYWESFPIEINDIERIEIIRGPSSALYGPNAVAGVINIITSKQQKFQSANFSWQRGSYNTDILNMSGGFKSEDFSLRLSGNYQRRNRYQSTYWDYSKGIYQSDPDSIYSVQTNTPRAFRGTAAQRYPDRNLALDKYGINLFGSYVLNEDINFDLSLGLQRSKIQKIYVDVIHTPFTTEESQTQYIDLKSYFYNTSFQISYRKGYQNTLGVQGWEYSFNEFSSNLEYELNLLNDKLSIRPGVSFRSFTIDDELSTLKYGAGKGLVNGRYTLTTLGGSIRIDILPFENLRFISALRLDKYNHPDKRLYLSYQLVSTYNFDRNNILRAVVSRANKGANILDTYINFTFIVPNVFENYYRPNPNLNLMTMDMFELGYRSKITSYLQFDVELFYQKSKDFSVATGLDSIVGYKAYLSAQNLSIEPEQKGVTVSLNFIPTYRIQLKPFLTFQETFFKNVKNVYGSSSSNLFNEWDEYTPKWFGGLYFNYNPVTKLNLNATLYYFSENKMKYQYNKVSVIYAKLLFNTKIAYFFTGKTNVFVSLKNINLLTAIKNDKTKPETTALNQSGFADYIQPLFLFGIDVDL